MILVTGATGHIGNVLVRSLLKKGYSVRAMVAPREDTLPLQNLDVEIVRGDIRDSEFVLNSCRNVEAVFHLAGVISILPTKKRLVYEVNVNGTNNVLRACERLRTCKLIYTSSIHAFAEPEPGATLDESTPIDPTKTSGIYGKSKAIATLNVLKAIKGGLNAVICCPTGVIGPYDFRISEMGNLILKYMQGKMKIAVDGCFDFVDVRDVASGLIEMFEKAPPGELFILSGHSITIRQLMELLHTITKQQRVKIFLKPALAYALSLLTSLYYSLSKKKALFTPYSVHTLTRYYRYSHRKASHMLGYEPRPIVESLKDSISWFSQRHQMMKSLGKKNAALLNP